MPEIVFTIIKSLKKDRNKLYSLASYVQKDKCLKVISLPPEEIKTKGFLNVAAVSNPRTTKSKVQKRNII